MKWVVMFFVVSALAPIWSVLSPPVLPGNAVDQQEAANLVGGGGCILVGDSDCSDHDCETGRGFSLGHGILSTATGHQCNSSCSIFRGRLACAT